MKPFERKFIYIKIATMFSGAVDKMAPGEYFRIEAILNKTVKVYINSDGDYIYEKYSSREVYVEFTKIPKDMIAEIYKKETHPEYYL